MRWFAAVLALSAAPALATEPARMAEPESLDITEIPKLVSDASACDVDTTVTRWAVQDFVLFAFRCPGNNSNYMQSFVRADDMEGHGAALVTFPPPPYSQGQPAPELSNARVFAGSGSIGAIWVDDERAPGMPCRFETLFRFSGSEPRMVFHRHSSECEARPGQMWTVILDERTPAELKEDWETD